MLWLFILGASLISCSAGLVPETIQTVASGPGVYLSQLIKNRQGALDLIEWGDQKLFVAQHDLTGAQRWRTMLLDAGFQPSFSGASAPDGSLWLASTTSSTNTSIALFHIDDLGQVNARRTIDQFSSSLARLAVDPQGNCYLAGLTRTGALSDQSDSILVLKYAPDGSELWRRPYSPPSPGAMQLTGIATDPAGNFIVAGSASLIAGATTLLALKFDSKGVLQWERLDEAASFGSALAVAVDGSVCATVTMRSGFRTVKYNASGDRLWVAPRG